jgi:hypothetical protein
MKTIFSIILTAALGLMMACQSPVNKEVKVTNKDSVVTKDVTVNFGCKGMGNDTTCNMDKCCSSKVCDSLCNELSKIICKIVDIRVKQTLCMQHCKMDMDKKCDPGKCDPAKCDPKCKAHGKE